MLSKARERLEHAAGLDPLSLLSARNPDLDELVAPPDACDEPVEADEDAPLALLTGEKMLMKLPKCALEAALGGALVHGQVIMTTFEIRFLVERWSSPADEQAHAHLPPSFYRVPLASIDKIEHRRALDGVIRVSMGLKDARTMKLVLTATSQVENAIKVLLTYAFPGRIELLFAFNHRLRPRGAEEDAEDAEGAMGHRLFDVMREFERQGVLRPRRLIHEAGECMMPAPWRVSHANEGHRLCGSYPSLLVVPAECDDTMLAEVAAFRSEGRLPTLSWGSSTTAASIWRSSQPKVGVAGASSPADERMLTAIALAGTLPADASARPADGPAIERSKSVCHIVDCRPRSNATANKLTGHGYESAANYPYCSLSFWNIGNIHVMRESLAALVALAHSDGRPSSGAGALASASGVGTAGEIDSAWLSAVESTGWLSHVRQLLAAAHHVVEMVSTRHAPVLVHCSHGWDRTAQVCALAQLLLDPYFRTLDGFATLIEKEFVSFGHPFQQRLAHAAARGEKSRNDEQLAPIMLQWLDAVWQLTTLFPSHFEFGSPLLCCIADHLISGRFGTFLCDNEREREELRLRSRTPSLWEYVGKNRQIFTSAAYLRTPVAPTGVAPSLVPSPETNAPLMPPLSGLLRNVALWADYHLRFAHRPSILPLGYGFGTSAAAKPVASGTDFEVPWAPSSDAHWNEWLREAVAEGRQWRERASAVPRARAASMLRSLQDLPESEPEDQQPPPAPPPATAPSRSSEADHAQSETELREAHDEIRRLREEVAKLRVELDSRGGTQEGTPIGRDL